MAQKKHYSIIVLFGGTSDEHSISVGSGKQVIKGLQNAGMNIIPVFISRSGRWFVPQLDTVLRADLSLSKNADTTIFEKGSKEITPVYGLLEISHDIIFIAMHGPGGEDGRLQGSLDMAGLKYVGTGFLASAIGMHKDIFASLAEKAKVVVPRTLTLHIAQTAVTQIRNTFSMLPIVIKPADQGSSVGVTIVRSWVDLENACSIAFTKSDCIIAQEYIVGRECTVGILGTKEPSALPVIEIISENEFFDYESKYLSQKTKEVCPAVLRKDQVESIQQAALATYVFVGCRTFARVDVILEKSGRVVVLEINTIPGMTPASLLPKAAAAAGYTFEQFLAFAIDDAMQQYR